MSSSAASSLLSFSAASLPLLSCSAAPSAAAPSSACAGFSRAFFFARFCTGADDRNPRYARRPLLQRCLSQSARCKAGDEARNKAARYNNYSASIEERRGTEEEDGKREVRPTARRQSPLRSCPARRDVIRRTAPRHGGRGGPQAALDAARAARRRRRRRRAGSNNANTPFSSRKCTSPPWRRQHPRDAWPLPATGEASQGRQTKRAAPPRAKVLRRAAGRWGWVAARRRLRSADHEHAISIPTATDSDPNKKMARQGGEAERDGGIAGRRPTLLVRPPPRAEGRVPQTCRPASLHDRHARPRWWRSCYFFTPFPL